MTDFELLFILQKSFETCILRLDRHRREVIRLY